MKKRLSSVIFVFAVLIGLSFLLYPTLSDYINRIHQSKAINEYVKKVAAFNDDDYGRLLEEAYAYNNDTANRTNPFIMTKLQQSVYEDRLNILGTGMMGYIEISSIDCKLPIYHGTSNGVLQRGVGHLEWTSLPTGGKNTHSVLSGHRGLPSAKLFTNLSNISVGDTFTVRVLNKTLTYEVDKILTVKPEDTTALQIISGEDLCTLMTCTPYGINTHRLLVRGHRIENISEAGINDTTPSTEKTNLVPLVYFISTLTVIAIIIVTVLLKRKRKSRKG